MPSGGRNHQTGRAGEHYVAAELNRRGYYAVTFAGNMPDIDVMASNADRTRTIYIQVKTKTRGNWQTRVGEAYKQPNPDSLWILVDIPDGAGPRYWIMPDSWIRGFIKEQYEAYTEKFKTDHMSLSYKQVSGWEDRWDLLGLKP